MEIFLSDSGYDGFKKKEADKTSFSIINSCFENNANCLHLDSSVVDQSWTIHNSGFSYLFGPHNREAVDFLIQSTNNISQIPAYVHIYEHSFTNNEINKIKSYGLKVKDRTRIKLMLEHPIPPTEYEQNTKPIEKNDIPLLSRLDLDLWKKFWNDTFLENSFGVISKVENDIAAICYAAGLDNNEAEIDIYCREEYRQQGFAKNTLLRFLKECKVRNVKPSWDCFTSNKPSLSLAKKVGFTPLFSYQFLSIYNPQK